jgi:hypothetical protein
MFAVIVGVWGRMLASEVHLGHSQAYSLDVHHAGTSLAGTETSGHDLTTATRVHRLARRVDRWYGQLASAGGYGIGLNNLHTEVERGVG